MRLRELFEWPVMGEIYYTIGFAITWLIIIMILISPIIVGISLIKQSFKTK